MFPYNDQKPLSGSIASAGFSCLIEPQIQIISKADLAIYILLSSCLNSVNYTNNNPIAFTLIMYVCVDLIVQ